MKILTSLIVILYLTSCNYPDIDSVPDFKDVKLTKEELFDLCQISADVKSEIDRCLKEKQ